MISCKKSVSDAEMIVLMALWVELRGGLRVSVSTRRVRVSSHLSVMAQRNKEIRKLPVSVYQALTHS